MLIGEVSWLRAAAAAASLIAMGIGFSHGLRFLMPEKGWRGMRRLLADFTWLEIVGEAVNIEEAAGKIEALSPDAF